MILLHWGESYIPLKNATYGMSFSDTYKNVGFVDGDILLKADKSILERFDYECRRKIIEAKTVTVLRDGREVVINIPEDMMQRMLVDKQGDADFRFPMIIDQIEYHTAIMAGLKEKDRIVCVNGISAMYYSEIRHILYEYRGHTVPIEVIRDGQQIEMNVPIDSDGRIGIMQLQPSKMFETVTVRYNFFSSFPAGAMLGVNTLKGYVSDMKYVFTKEGAKSLGGFGAIGNLFPAQWDWVLFWERTAFLSIILAFMNILPIPALDGGHVMFLLYEVVTRRKPADKFLEYAQIAGMALLIMLLLYANGNDVFRFFFK
jgi:regulator of sigma E protease